MAAYCARSRVVRFSEWSALIAGPELRSKRRRSALIFVGGMSGLMASYAVAFTITYLAAGRL